ncbi:MAG: anthranilate phosphoribosyltransferase [Nitrososphaerales archaeon]
MPHIKEAISNVVSGKSLSEEEAALIAEEMMSGSATQSQMGAFLTALRMKGETIDEIAGFAKAMRSKAVRITPNLPPGAPKLTDLCGTGGDLLKTFNVSTLSSFVVSGAGVPVAKHGNRSVTSKCGSADLLEKLGVNINASPKDVERSIEISGIGFMFAPTFHPATKYAAPIRKEIGIRTVFNVLGPLTCPAGAKAQLMGVYDESLVRKMAEALRKLGIESALIVHGAGGLDEISTFGKTHTARLFEDGRILEELLSPSNFGLKQVEYSSVAAPENVEEYPSIALRLLSGQSKLSENEVSILDMIIANSSAAIVISGRAENYIEGVELARESINSGKAMEKLSALVKLSSGDMSVIESFLLKV